MAGFSMFPGTNTGIKAEYGSNQAKPFIPGGTNTIIWGDEVTEGSSGGNTSYNPATGKVQYVAGYENAPKPTTAAAPAPTKTSTASKSTSTKAPAAPKAAAPKPMTMDNPITAEQRAAENAARALRMSGGAAPAPSAPGAPAATPTAESDPSNVIRAPMNTAPTDGPGGGALGGGAGLAWIDGPAALRSGIGQRTMPQYSALLAGLSRAY